MRTRVCTVHVQRGEGQDEDMRGTIDSTQPTLADKQANIGPESIASQYATATVACSSPGFVDRSSDFAAACTLSSLALAIFVAVCRPLFPFNGLADPPPPHPHLQWCAPADLPV